MKRSDSTRVASSSRLLPLAFGLAVSLSLVGPSRPVAAAVDACTDESNLCLEPVKGARWQPGKHATANERKKRSTKNGGTLSVTIEGGRGSVFVNGRYAGTAPVQGIAVPRGKNDIQVRDGAQILADGALVVPAGASLTVTVRHP